jgi:peptidoglycan/LPS O-acetylase OafA/YrhL
MKKEYQFIDFARFICAMFIVAIHSGFLDSIPHGLFIRTFVFRVAVPFFFICSGFFLGKSLYNIDSHIERQKIILKYIKRLLIPYIFWSLFYLISSDILNNQFTISNVLNDIHNIITLNPPTITWFVASLIGPAILLLFANTKRDIKYLFIVSIFLYLIGLLFSSYNFLFTKSFMLDFNSFFINKFMTNRHWFFVGCIFVYIGYYIGLYENNKIFKPNIKLICIYIISLIMLFFEDKFIILRTSNIGLCDFCLSQLLNVPILFILIKNSKLRIKNHIILRKLSSITYYIHYFILSRLFIFNDNNSQLMNFMPSIPWTFRFYFVSCSIIIFFAILIYLLPFDKINNKLF